MDVNINISDYFNKLIIDRGVELVWEALTPGTQKNEWLGKNEWKTQKNEWLEE